MYIELYTGRTTALDANFGLFPIPFGVDFFRVIGKRELRMLLHAATLISTFGCFQQFVSCFLDVCFAHAEKTIKVDMSGTACR
jgi:hypothetical protein